MAQHGLTKLIRAQGYLVAEIAAALNVHTFTVYRWATRPRSVSLESKLALAKELGVNIKTIEKALASDDLNIVKGK